MRYPNKGRKHRIVLDVTFDAELTEKEAMWQIRIATTIEQLVIKPYITTGKFKQFNKVIDKVN